jgi:heat shock protein HtpX
MWEAVRTNQRKTVFLVIAMAALLMGVGYAFGMAFLGDPYIGLIAAGAIWLVMTLISYNQGSNIMLAVSGARKIGPDDHPILWNVVEEMKIASGLPKMPDVYIINDPAPNAFATGRSPDKAAVACTAGLLEMLNRSELQAVMAHELGHVKNRDILYMMMMGVMMGAIVMLADVGARMLFWGGGRSRTSSRESGGGQMIAIVIALVLMIIAPIVAQIIYFAVSRKREYLADASAAAFTRYPAALASALEKISGYGRPMKNVSRALAPSFIINPMMQAKGKKKKKGFSLFSTHPPMEERVKILRAMSRDAGLGSYDSAYQSVTGRAVGVIPFSTLEKAEKIEISQPEQAEHRTPLQRKRQSNDMIWKTQNFGFVACSCGTKLKIPPKLRGKTVSCPHCGSEHNSK